MIPAHLELYSRLTEREASLVWSRLHDGGLIPPHPRTLLPSGPMLGQACSHLSHAEVILTMSGEASQEWVEIMCKLLRRPMYMCARGETGEPLTDVLGRPLPVPLGHRIGEPVPDYTIPGSKIMRRLPRSPRRDTRVVTRVTQPNPKKPGSQAHQRYALYSEGMTVSDYLAAGGRPGDVKYDIDHGYIDVGLPGAVSRRTP